MNYVLILINYFPEYFYVLNSILMLIKMLRFTLLIMTIKKSIIKINLNEIESEYLKNLMN